MFHMQHPLPDPLLAPPLLLLLPTKTLKMRMWVLLLLVSPLLPIDLQMPLFSRSFRTRILSRDSARSADRRHRETDRE